MLLDLNHDAVCAHWLLDGPRPEGPLNFHELLHNFSCVTLGKFLQLLEPHVNC